MGRGRSENGNMAQSGSGLFNVILLRFFSYEVDKGAKFAGSVGLPSFASLVVDIQF